MARINFIAVGVITVLSFAASAIYYGAVVGGIWMEISGIKAGGIMLPQVVAQLLRDLFVTFMLARLFVWVGAKGPIEGLKLGLFVWLGFEAMAIIGSVIHESYPWQLYLIHTGDALMKTVLASLILGAWPRKQMQVA